MGALAILILLLAYAAPAYCGCRSRDVT
jgi:hypothetical protein